MASNGERCAAGAVLGKRKKRVRGSGTYKVCLTPSQRKKLFRNASIGKPIGCGTFACVYARDDGDVVKLTKDREDVEGMLAAKGIDRVVRVRQISELKNAGRDERTGRPVPVYAIVAERLQPFTRSEQKWLSKPLDVIKNETYRRVRRFHGEASNFAISKSDSAAIAHKACARGPAARRCEKFANELVDAFAQLVRHGVVFQDMHGGNFGKTDRGYWKILDLGYSGITKRTIVPVLQGIRGERKL